MFDQIAIETSVSLTLAGGAVIRHASATAFLGLKWAAYADRGAEDPFASHDLEDILALIASRPLLPAEIADCRANLGTTIVRKTRELLADGHPDLLARHLNNAQSPALVAKRIFDRLSEIARLDRKP